MAAETLIGPSDGNMENRLPIRSMYTGCLRAGPIPGTFVLSDASRIPAHATQPLGRTHHGRLMLVGPSFHLGGRIGRQVAVAGWLVPPVPGATDEIEPILSVNSVRTVAARCQIPPPSAGPGSPSPAPGRS